MGSVRVDVAGQQMDLGYTISSTEPTGAGITSITKIVGDTLTAKLGSIAAGSQVSFPAGVFGDPDFNRPANYPVYSIFEQKAGALLGSGIDRTVFACPAGTSTKAFQVPPQGPATSFPVGTNPLWTMRVDGSPLLSGCTVKGLEQGHPYGGLILFQTTGASLVDVKFKGIPGTAAANPGETFSLSLYRTTNTTATRVEVDGTNDAGAKVAASGIGLNFAAGTTRLTGCHLHGMAHGAGVTAYQSTGSIIYEDLVSEDNVLPANFERCAATPTTVTLTRPVFRRCSARTADGQPVHLVLDSDYGSAKVSITDPVFDGAKFTVCVHQNYWGSPQKQSAADISLTVGGVARPDLLRIVTNYTLS